VCVCVCVFWLCVVGLSRRLETVGLLACAHTHLHAPLVSTQKGPGPHHQDDLSNVREDTQISSTLQNDRPKLDADEPPHSTNHDFHRRLLSLTTYPMQTYYIPISESLLLTNSLQTLVPTMTNQSMESIISIAVSSEKTILWYDHWEDGFDKGKVFFKRCNPSTRAARNAANGCPPKVTPCIDANDRIYAGQSFVIQTTIPYTRAVGGIYFDAGDRLQANLPVAVTRGAYPTLVGSVIAGSADVYDTTAWGQSFTVPMGPNLNKTGLFTGSTAATVDWFEHTALYFMAAQDGTVVTKPDGTTVTLRQGETGYALALMGQTLTSTKNIQVHAVTGDIGAVNEMRWFSLLPRDDCTFQMSNCNKVLAGLDSHCAFPFAHFVTRARLYIQGNGSM
jgi:hypothetical protein